MKLISVCISAYEMGGFGAEFLKNNFEILTHQTFKNFDVVVSDQSKNDAIKDICEEYKDKLDIKYFKNKNFGNASDNINTGIKKATGKLIKILFLDDFLYKDTSLQEIADNFDLEKDGWLLTGNFSTQNNIFYRPFVPKYDDETVLMKNNIGAPSVMTMKNDGEPVLFDENLVWWQDLDYYKRCFKKFGQPKILKEVNVAIRVHPHQITNTIATEKRREKEFQYILKKYNIKWAFFLAVVYKYKKNKRLLKIKLKQWSPKIILQFYWKCKKIASNLVTTTRYRVRFYPLIIRWNTSDCAVAKQIFVDRQYDLNYENIEPKLIIDGGANVGYTSVFFANKFPTAEIYSIEPDKSNFKVLKRNTAKYKTIHPINKGLWNKQGRLKVINQKEGKWALMTTEVGPHHNYDTETITIDDILKISERKEIDILKLDIEGAEKELFSENYDSWLGKVNMIIIELHDKMKSGCEAAFYKATEKYNFRKEESGENIVLKKIKP